jgi:acetate kinase
MNKDHRAREAVDLFVYRIGRELGWQAAARDGIDGIVVTGALVKIQLLSKSGFFARPNG